MRKFFVVIIAILTTAVPAGSENARIQVLALQASTASFDLAEEQPSHEILRKYLNTKWLNSWKRPPELQIIDTDVFFQNVQLTEESKTAKFLKELVIDSDSNAPQLLLIYLLRQSPERFVDFELGRINYILNLELTDLNTKRTVSEQTIPISLPAERDMSLFCLESSAVASACRAKYLLDGLRLIDNELSTFFAAINNRI